MNMIGIRNVDGNYCQKNIRGNHIAVVERGRAGKRAAILDSDTINKEKAGKRPERKIMKKHGLFFNLFGQAVSGKSPEEIEQMAMDAAAALDEEEGSGGTTAEEKKENAGTVPAKDAAFFDALDKKVDRLLAALDGQVSGGSTEKDPMDEAIEKLEGAKDEGTEGKKSEGEAKVVPAEEMDTDNEASMDQAMAAAILKAMKPTVAAISDPKQRKAVTDALFGAVGLGNDDSDISKLMKVVQKNAKKTVDSKSVMDEAAMQAAYDNMNPHKKAENGGKR